MTPQIWHRVSVKVAPYEPRLAKYGLLFFALFVAAILINISITDVLYPLVVVPLGATFFLAGLGIVVHTFRISVEGGDFESHWKSLGVIKKLHLWYASVFIALWYFGVVVITIGTLLATIVLGLS